MTGTQIEQSPENDSAPAVFTNILCAVDGTRASTAAVRMAVCLAGPTGRLTLLAVTAQSGAGRYATAAISPGRVTQVLNRAKRLAEAAGVPTTTIADPGGPPVKIILARASGHDLLAIGAPATSWIGGMLISGVAAASLSLLTTPALFVRASFTGSLGGREILVASDGQDGSDEIVELAGRLGLSQHAPVTLIHALGPESRARPHRIEAQARTLALMLPGGADTHVEPGKAGQVILAAAKRSKPAITVIGSRGLGGVLALGSVSRRVVHGAPCAVLLVPQGRRDLRSSRGSSR